MSIEMSDADRAFWKAFQEAIGRQMDQIIMDTFLKTSEQHDEIASLESQWDKS